MSGSAARQTRPTHAPPSPDRAGGATGRALPAVAALACAAAGALVLGLVLAGGRPQPAIPGLPDPGSLTGWGLPALRLAFDVAGVGTVGLLLAGAVLLSAGPQLSGAAQAAVRAAASWSAAWCLCALGLLALTVSDVVGAPVTALSYDALAQEAAGGPGRALLVAAAAAAAVAAGARRARTTRAARRLLAGSLLALLPTTVTGHAASAADHDLATTALVVHVVAASLWVGGLLAVVRHVRRSPDVLARAVQRFSVVALAAFASVALSGVLGAWARIGSSGEAWTSGYGLLVLAKTGALVLLGAAGWYHRRRLVPAVVDGRPRSFLTFAVVELAVMGAAVGLAAALSRTPTPAVVAAAPRPAHGVGHETLAASVEPMTLTRLLLAWRPDALVLVVLGLALATYAAGVRSLRGAGEPVSWWRVGAFTAGVAVGVYALCGGLATYAPATVSAQLGQFVLVLVVVPALLVLGAPLTLWTRVRRVRAGGGEVDAVPPVLRGRAARLLADPFTGLALVTVLVFAVYRTTLIEQSLRSFWVHLLVNALALVVGTVLLWPALGADPVPVERTVAERLLPLLALAASLGVLAVQLRYGDDLLAGRWFLELRWPWIDPVQDQRRGAVVVAAATALIAPLLVVALRTPSRALAGFASRSGRPPAPVAGRRRR